MARSFVIPKGTPWEQFPPYSTGGGRVLVEEWKQAYGYVGPVSLQDFLFTGIPDNYFWPGELPQVNEYGEVAP